MKLKTGMRGHNNGLCDLISSLPSGIVMAEVGCYAGESTLLFMKSGKINVLYAIDPWGDTWEGDVPAEKIDQYKFCYDNMRWAEQSFDFRTKGYDVIKCRGTLVKFMEKLPELDFIYIDGDHRYKYVKNDIELSKTIVKKGGIIAGHDYNQIELDVIKAVDEIFGKPDKIFKDTSWLKYV